MTTVGVWLRCKPKLPVLFGFVDFKVFEEKNFRPLPSLGVFNTTDAGPENPATNRRTLRLSVARIV